MSKYTVQYDDCHGQDTAQEQRSDFRIGVVEPLVIGLALIGIGIVLGYFIALAAMTTYMP